MTTPSGPSYARDDVLAAVKALAPLLRAASDEVESERSLTEPLVQAMVDAGLYRLLLPRSLGGGEMDPLAYFDVIEALAQADSAAATGSPAAGRKGATFSSRAGSTSAVTSTTGINRGAGPTGGPCICAACC